jgi:hypothetical protein
VGAGGKERETFPVPHTGNESKDSNFFLKCPQEEARKLIPDF